MKKPIVLFFLFSLFTFNVSIVSADEEQFVYYCHVPEVDRLADVPRQTETGLWPAPLQVLPAYLLVTGIEDGTHVEVRKLLGPLIAEFTVNRMEARAVNITEMNIFLKVVSDKRVAVALAGKGGLNSSLATYPSTTGGKVGREFIFTSIAGFWESLHRVFALEDAEVAVYDAEGKVLQEFELWQGEAKDIVLDPGRVYRIASTGRILVEACGLDSFKFLPSVSGRYVDREFRGMVVDHEVHRSAFMVIPYEPCTVKVYDHRNSLRFEHKFTEEDLDEGRYWLQTTEQGISTLHFVSTGDITVLLADQPWYAGESPEKLIGDDIAQAGVKSGAELRFYTPNRAIIFASQATNVVVDGIPSVIAEDEFMILQEGFHVVQADKSLIIQVEGSGTYPPTVRGWYSYSEYLLPPQDVDLTLPPPEPTKKGEGGTSMLTGYAAAGIIAIFVAAFLIYRKLSKR